MKYVKTSNIAVVPGINLFEESGERLADAGKRQRKTALINGFIKTPLKLIFDDGYNLALVFEITVSASASLEFRVQEVLFASETVFIIVFPLFGVFGAALHIAGADASGADRADIRYAA